MHSLRAPHPAATCIMCQSTRIYHFQTKELLRNFSGEGFNPIPKHSSLIRQTFTPTAKLLATPKCMCMFKRRELRRRSKMARQRSKHGPAIDKDDDDRWIIFLSGRPCCITKQLIILLVDPVFILGIFRGIFPQKSYIPQKPTVFFASYVVFLNDYKIVWN